MTEEDGFSQRAKSFIREIGQGTVSFTDEELASIKRFVKRRGRDAAHVTVAPVDTAQYCSPRSPSPETSFGARVCTEKNEKGRTDPERDQLESPSAGTGFETRTAVSPNLGDRTNHCRRLLARYREFEYWGKHFFPRRNRCWETSRQQIYSTIHSIKHRISAGGPQTRRQRDRQ